MRHDKKLRNMDGRGPRHAARAFLRHRKDDGAVADAGEDHAVAGDHIARDVRVFAQKDQRFIEADARSGY